MSFPRYPKYKASGVEWLGDVPEHWHVLALKRDLEFVTSGSRGWAENYSEAGRLFLRIANLTRDRIDLDLSNVQRVEVPTSSSETLRTEVRAGDVLFSITAYLGSVAVVPEGLETAYVSQHVALARLRLTLLSSRWVAYVAFSSAGKTWFDQQSYGGTKIQLSLDDVRDLRVTAPPLAEQNAISAFLDRETAKIDGLVAEQRRLMELLKEKRQAVISHAVTKGLNPDAPMRPSGIKWLGDVPAHWAVMTLKRIADVHTGVAKGKDNGSRPTISVPYLRVANVQDGYLDLEDVATIDIPIEDLERCSLRPGDVLMNEGGDFDKLGRGHVWDGQIDACITQNHVFAVRPRGVSSAWLNTVTGSSGAQFYFMIRSKQSTNLASISSTNLMELPIAIPPADEQLAILSSIDEQIAAMDALTTESQRAIDLLQERRTALISAAVTGQIDVRGSV